MVAPRFAQMPKPEIPAPEVVWVLASEQKLWAEGLPDGLAFVAREDLAGWPLLLICWRREYAVQAAELLGVTAKPLAIHPQVFAGVLIVAVAIATYVGGIKDQADA